MFIVDDSIILILVGDGSLITNYDYFSWLNMNNEYSYIIIITCDELLVLLMIDG